MTTGHRFKYYLGHRCLCPSPPLLTVITAAILLISGRIQLCPNVNKTIMVQESPEIIPKMNEFKISKNEVMKRNNTELFSFK
jgi:hypothetical protein